MASMAESSVEMLRYMNPVTLMNLKRLIVLAWLVLGLIACLALSCARLRVSGYPRQEPRLHFPGGLPALEVAASTHARRQSPEEYFPAKELTPEQMDSLFFSDLGPDEIDVSSYPRGQQGNYSVYRRACSQCHTLARSINAPTVSRRFWELYMLGMRFQTKFRPGTGLPADDREAILDFLEYDSKIRKIERRNEFEELQDELKRRYEPVLKRRLQNTRR